MRALVMSGGGSKGQYHVGAIGYLAGHMGRTYDLYAGVSVGALVAGFMAQYPPGNGRLAAQDLRELFSPIESKDIWKHWFLFREASIWRASAYNSEPIQKLVKSHLRGADIKNSGSKLRVGAVSLKTGEYRVFDETFPQIAEAVLASSSYPAFFEPIEIDGQLWTDGGVRNVTPIKAAIDAGCDEIDVIVCQRRGLYHSFEKDPEWPDVAFRSLAIMTDEIIWNDIKIAQMYNRLLQLGDIPGKRPVKLNVVFPKEGLNKNSLNFDPEEAVKIQDTGWYDASRLFLNADA